MLPEIQIKLSEMEILIFDAILSGLGSFQEVSNMSVITIKKFLDYKTLKENFVKETEMILQENARNNK